VSSIDGKIDTNTKRSKTKGGIKMWNKKKTTFKNPFCGIPFDIIIFYYQVCFLKSWQNLLSSAILAFTVWD